MSLVKSTATIGGYTLVSRVLGFVRDVTIASTIGASFLSDAFFVAFKLPNFLRRLFAEGAFNSAFVPLFAGMLARDGKDKAKAFASEAMSFLLLILIAVTGLFVFSMPWLMHLLAPGFVGNPQKFDLAVTLTQITMPYIIFISLVSLLGGMLNSSDKFAAVAATPILMNLCLIVLPYCMKDLTPTGAHALAVAVMVSGIVQWLWLVWFCHKDGMLPRLTMPKLSPDVKKLLVLIAPAALGAGVAQINLFIDIIIASQFDSGVSYIYYADRINELPLAVIGIAVGTALLPMLSRQIRQGDLEAAYDSQHRALELALFLSLPAAVGLFIIAQPVISVMFERGAFGPADTAATYKVLMAFAVGLPAFILIKILAPSFYAQQDTATPFKIATLCIAINLFFNLILMGPLQYVGMAVATTIAGWVNVGLMSAVLLKRKWMVIRPHFKIQLLKIILPCMVMGLSLIWLRVQMQPYMGQGELLRFSALIAVALAGAASYFLAAFILNTLNVRRLLRRRA
jgi:putative peptidoglycan lipid II flippase